MTTRDLFTILQVSRPVVQRLIHSSNLPAVQLTQRGGWTVARPCSTRGSATSTRLPDGGSGRTQPPPQICGTGPASTAPPAAGRSALVAEGVPVKSLNGQLGVQQRPVW